MVSMTDHSVKLKDWKSGGYRAPWYGPRDLSGLTHREQVLARVLDQLALHDFAADVRDGAPHCVELQHAIHLLDEVAGITLYEMGTP
jgi:hypothetical protein